VAIGRGCKNALGQGLTLSRKTDAGWRHRHALLAANSDGCSKPLPSRGTCRWW